MRGGGGQVDPGEEPADTLTSPQSLVQSLVPEVVTEVAHR